MVRDIGSGRPLLHECEDAAILKDHFAVVFRRIDELDAIVEADAILDDGAKLEVLSVIGET